jgi:hypothetical protein
MALSIVKVQGSRAVLGPDLQQESILAIPGTSDYVTNGYVITTTLTSFLKIQTAWVSGSNATFSPANSGWYAECVFPLAQVGTGGPGFTGYAQFLLKVYVASTGVELANGGNLTGSIIQLTLQGY